MGSPSAEAYPDVCRESVSTINIVRFERSPMLRMRTQIGDCVRFGRDVKTADIQAVEVLFEYAIT